MMCYNKYPRMLFATICVALISFITTSFAQDTVAIATSFELGETPEYQLGSIHGQNGWLVSSGAGSVVEDPPYAYNSDRGLQIGASGSALKIAHTAFSASQAGLSGIVYFDMQVKVNSISGNPVTMNGYDLFGGSHKRTFVVDFTIPSGGNGSVRGYSDWHTNQIGTYSTGEWVRVSGKVNYSNAIYQILVDGEGGQSLDFRESYTPDRTGGVKEYHQLLFNFGSDDETGTTDFAVDSIYIGTSPLPDLNFPPLDIEHTVEVTQPVVGEITLDPPGPVFQDSAEVTATLTLPDGYMNNGWTGDLSGTELTKTFFVTQSMEISADVGVDFDSPPPLYLVTVIQPDTGYITLDPTGTEFYKHTPVTATLTVPAGYINLGWTGDLSGTALTQEFRVLSEMTLSAEVAQDTSEPEIIYVSTDDGFVGAVDEAGPGDIIEVAPDYYNVSLTMENSGTPSAPIIIRSEQRGEAELGGDSRMDLSQVGYLTIEGFEFTTSAYTAIKLQACHNIRITRNTFRLNESGSAKWILIGGIWDDPNATSHHNRVDHNLFDEKHQLGNCITIDGQDDPVYQVSQYDRIDHNYFRNIGPRHENEMETIRIGWSEMSMSSGYAVVEYNLFENCDGDPEIISVKSCDNTVRYNTFRRSQGTVALRHGNRNTVDGNFFFGEGKSGTGGVRVYGDDHRIFNNYFQGLTGTRWDAAITLTNGDYDSGSDYTAHWRINRAEISNNTLVNNLHNIEIGFTNNGNYGKPPRDVVIADNLAYGVQNELIKVYTGPINMTYSGNIMYPDSAATLGISATGDEVSTVNPELQMNGAFYRPMTGSPVIDAGVGLYDYVSDDMDGQPRDESPDVGADEFSQEPMLRRPLTPDDVGPDAGMTGIEEPEEKSIPTRIGLLRSYPNPFNGGTVITFQLERSQPLAVEIYDIRGRLLTTLADRSFSEGIHSINWIPHDLPSGMYFCRIFNKSFQSQHKLIYLK